MQSVESFNFEDYSLEDFIDMLYLKNELDSLSLQELTDECSNVLTYAWTIDKANILLDSEPAFFLLDDSYIEKMYSLINTYRFEFSDPDFLHVSNEVISNLNSLAYLDRVSKNSRLEHYRLWQQDCRKLDFIYFQDFKAAVVNDALVYLKFDDGNEIQLANGDILSSLNYFSMGRPTIFREKNFYYNAIQYLDSLIDVPFYKKIKPIYQYAKESKERIQKVKKS